MGRFAKRFRRHGACAVLQLLISLCQACLPCLRVPLAAKARWRGRGPLLLLDIGGGVLPADMGGSPQWAPGDRLAALLQLGIGGGHTYGTIFGGSGPLVKGNALAALL